MNYHKKAIELLDGMSPDSSRNALIKMVMKHPKSFCDLHNIPNSSLGSAEWLSCCRDHAKNGRLLDAVKLYRFHTKCSLMEAKKACEQLRDSN